MKKRGRERLEALMRLLVLIVGGIILGIWEIVIDVVVVIHWIWVIITGKRVKGLARFCQIWNVNLYKFLKYVTFVSDKRPFPFGKLEKK